jgi:hypothetical protein
MIAGESNGSPPMRRTALLFAGLLGLTACAGTSPREPAPRTAAVRSVQVVCPVGGIHAECFRRASELCGADGYDLFDGEGRPATVADAEYHVLEARCRR